MKKSILYFLFAFILFKTNAQNQKADLIFNDGDVLEGYGMITKNGNIKFRISLEDKPDTWTNLMVKGITFYGFETSRTFEYIKLNKRDKPELVELIIKGKVNLYQKVSITNFSSVNFIGGSFQRNQTSYESTDLFVKRNNEKIATKLGFWNFKKKAKEYFKDCDVILEMLETGEYKKYSTEEFIDEYNIYCSE